MTATAIKTETGRITPRDLKAALSLAAGLGTRMVELRTDCTLRFGDETTAAVVPFPGRPWDGESAWLERVPLARVAQACGGDMLVTVENDGVTIESESLTVELPKMRAPETPTQAEGGLKLLTVPSLDLARLLVAAIPFAGRDQTRPVLCQVALDLKRGKVAVTDSYRLAVFDASMIQVEGCNDTLLLPRSACGPLAAALKLAGGGVQINRASDTLSLSFGSQCWTVREEKGTFPDWQQLLPDEHRFETRLTVGAGDLRATASLLADLGMRNAPLRLKIETDEVTVSAECPDRAVVRQQLAATVDRVASGGVEVGLNPEFTRDIATAIAPERAHLALIGALRPVLFTAPGALYLQMPIRLNG